VAYGAHYTYQNRTIDAGVGALAKEEPVQLPLLPNQRSFQQGHYQVIPLARYQMKARVLSRENYYMGREADLSPVDLALGWGQMSDGAVISKIEISQSNRWYYWQTQEAPIPLEMIAVQSANTHMIPANSTVKNQLEALHAGHVVFLSGFLVEVKASDGWQWRSSLSREDTGDGACEVMWVEQVVIEHP
jgi:hypothetical protein